MKIFYNKINFCSPFNKVGNRNFPLTAETGRMRPETRLAGQGASHPLIQDKIRAEKLRGTKHGLTSDMLIFTAPLRVESFLSNNASKGCHLVNWIYPCNYRGL